MMLGGENRQLTSIETLLSGLAAGVSSGLVCGPAELMMIQQQLKGGNILQRAKEIGPRALRALVPTATREGACPVRLFVQPSWIGCICMLCVPTERLLPS